MNKPDCQCSLWTTHPDALASQGIDRGFCGRCEICGQGGHTRHFPGTSPSSGAWCESHYNRLLWLHPMGWYGRRIYVAVLVVAFVAFTLWRI